MANTLTKKSGPAFPFKSSIYGVLGNKTRRESLQTSIYLILTTPKGSIPYNQDLGSHVPLLVFEPLNDAVINLIHYYVVEDLEAQDPRVKVISIMVAIPESHNLLVQIGYRDRDDPSEVPQQTSIPFVRGL